MVFCRPALTLAEGQPWGSRRGVVETDAGREAERCHELAYIADGRILARGTEREIVAQAALVVWSVAGDGSDTLVEPLKRAPGVLSVAAFGNALHVAGRDEAALAAAIAPWRERPGLAWRRTDANLEDVFISLIGQSQADGTMRDAA